MTALSIHERAREIARKIHADNATYSRSERDRNDLMILTIQHALEDERELCAKQLEEWSRTRFQDPDFLIAAKLLRDGGK